MRARPAESSVPTRLAGFAAMLVVVGSLAALAGAATGSAPSTASKEDDEMAMDAMTPMQQARANGLSSVAGGYAFVPVRTTLPLGRTTAFRFRILDEDGAAVRDIDEDGGVRVHLIVVRRDFAGYQHLHPTLRADGSWSVPLALAAPGAYRAFADFEVDGTKTVLGHDLVVPGQLAPERLPAPAGSVSSDGFTVRLTHDPLHAGEATKLHFDISRDGVPVPSFDAYVGHRGHLVALREGDLSYSHVHPEPDARVGEIVFHTELPSAGRYRLFLQFKVEGAVHTAPFTVAVGR
jgi:hypothetical protein